MLRKIIQLFTRKAKKSVKKTCRLDGLTFDKAREAWRKAEPGSQEENNAFDDMWRTARAKDDWFFLMKVVEGLDPAAHSMLWELKRMVLVGMEIGEGELHV